MPTLVVATVHGVSAVKPKVFAYAVAVDRSGRISAEDEASFVDVGDEWTADHLLLAAVARCSIVSLSFHARRAGFDLTARGCARGTVTKPEGEERFRFVQIDVEIDAELDPRPEPDALAQLLERAERDCFVGSSLVAKPAYSWHVK
jgi:organic hydroperoxide reductase OsmC/OhrA